jgi:hypothetical protein
MAALVSECDEIFSRVAASQSTEISKQKLRSARQSLSNTNNESKHAGTEDKTQFSKFITSSATGLGTALLAVGLLLTVPCAKAQTTVSMTDRNFILAADI